LWEKGNYWGTTEEGGVYKRKVQIEGARRISLETEITGGTLRGNSRTQGRNPK